MIALLFMQHVYEGARQLLDEITRPPDDIKLRHKFTREAIRFLDNNGGHLVHVQGRQVACDGDVSTDMLVVIHYSVNVRKDQAVAQFTSYSIDMTSWKALRNDLHVLGKQFNEALQRSYGDDKSGSDSILKEYSELLETIQPKVDARLK